MSRTSSVEIFTSTGDNRAVRELVDFRLPDGATATGQSMVAVLSETVPVTSFTDGGGAAGTYQMQGALPAGAIVLATKYGPIVGFAGDVSAVMIVGDGSTTNRFNTGTPSVFATAAVGIDCGVVSGLKLMLTTIRPTLTVTTSTDFTLAVSDGHGVVTVSIYYIPGA